MIGIDTNVIVRIFVEDSPEQTSQALKFLGDRSSDDPAFVSVVVLVELVWVLQRNYGYSAAAVFAAINSLFESSNLCIERAKMVQTAVAFAEEHGADVADCLIAAIAAEAGCSSTVTFDRIAAKRIPGMDLLA